MKIKVQAQHLRPGDVVGSGERVEKLQPAPSGTFGSKVHLKLSKGDRFRWTLWGRRTLINAERKPTLESAVQPAPYPEAAKAMARKAGIKLEEQP